MKRRLEISMSPEEENAMKSKLKAGLYFGLALSFTIVCAVPLVKAMQLDGPVNAIAAIAVPGGVGAVDILWVDQARGRLYLADRTKAAVHIVDAINDVYIDQVPGFVGAIGANGGRGGPNGVVVSPTNILWVGDGNSLLQIPAALAPRALWSCRRTGVRSV